MILNDTNKQLSVVNRTLSPVLSGDGLFVVRRKLFQETSAGHTGVGYGLTP